MEKYLRYYAEPETAALAGLLDSMPEQGSWSNVVVIPACNESSGLLRPPPPSGVRSLLILVINEPASASRQVSLNNKALAASVQARFKPQWQFEQKSSASGSGYELSLLRDPAAPRDVLLVDRFSAGRQLPPKGGVGQARKIGTDLATSLIHHGRICSRWIHCTDADVLLPRTYFTCANALRHSPSGAGSKQAALIYPFSHSTAQDKTESDKISLATKLYEQSLRYYVAGLRFARSPYAFHTIGSTLAISADHYAKVRGFPKREAGEDFYLLNKLAKVGSVMELRQDQDCLPIEIEARCSDRVPFGTGAAVSRISEMADPVNEFRFYDPAVFELLQCWLRSLPAIWRSRQTHLTIDLFPEDSVDQQDEGHKSIDRRLILLDGLKKAGTEQALDHAFRQSKDLEQFTRQVHTWFDAFRTLKLIHYLRDCHLTSISYPRLEPKRIFRRLLEQDKDLLALHNHLNSHC
jgi:hypothetical protein